MKRLTTAETATALRAALKAKFPGTRFSVRSKNYSGGSSITVRWTDGASRVAVEAVAEKFAGATFDGMIDLKGYKPPVLLNGETVAMGADYVFCDRSTSAEVLRKVVANVTSNRRFGYAPDTMVAWVENGFNGAFFNIPHAVDTLVGAELRSATARFDATLNLVVKEMKGAALV